MARRYVGNLAVSITYDDRNFYRASVSGNGMTWKGTVGAPAAGFGPGIAYDSPKAYDQAARAAVSFALDEMPDLESAFYSGPHAGKFRRPR
jgi:hypothetical protein